MIGQSAAVKAQAGAIADVIDHQWRGLGNSRERGRLMSLVLGLAELVAAEARAQERDACVAIAREVVDKWDFASTLVNADGVLAANEILHRIENRGRTHPAEWWTP